MRQPGPYTRFAQDDLILRDHLALDRTVLANERTFLAYVRTALATMAAGATLPKLFPDDRTFELVGWLLIAIGVACLAFGIYRTRTMAHKIATARQPDQ